MSADLLRRAATKLRQRAALATEGPWHASPVDSLNSHMNSALYSHAHPTGTPESEVVGAVRKDRSAGIRNPHDARYFELMHPPVALALADWLEFMADEENRIVGGLLTKSDTTTARVIHGWMQAIAAARAILREEATDAPR